MLPETKRRELIALVVAFLRSPKPPASFTTDDAAATCSRGYSYGVDAPWQDPKDPQPPGYATLVKRGQVSSGRVSQYDVEPDAGPSPREVPRWESDVVRSCDTAQAQWEKRFPLYLRAGVPRALAGLCPLDREIVDLVGRCWMSYRHAAQQVGVKSSTVFDHYNAALSRIVDEIWTAEGAPRY